MDRAKALMPIYIDSISNRLKFCIWATLHVTHLLLAGGGGGARSDKYPFKLNSNVSIHNSCEYRSTFTIPMNS